MRVAFDSTINEVAEVNLLLAQHTTAYPRQRAWISVRLFHDWYVRRHYERLIAELCGGAQTLRCEFELRSDVLWCKTPLNEISFPWSRLTRLEHTDRGIELWFNPGLAVVRDRAFADDSDRRRFLEAATKANRSA